MSGAPASLCVLSQGGLFLAQQPSGSDSRSHIGSGKVPTGPVAPSSLQGKAHVLPLPGGPSPLPAPLAASPAPAATGFPTLPARPPGLCPGCAPCLVHPRPAPLAGFHPHISAHRPLSSGQGLSPPALPTHQQAHRPPASFPIQLLVTFQGTLSLCAFVYSPPPCPHSLTGPLPLKAEDTETFSSS